MLRKALFFLALILCTALAWNATASAADEAPRISKEELKAQLGNPTVMILDVRTERDWSAGEGKIAGAVREDPEAFNEWGGKFPKDKTLVLYCA